MEPRNRDCMACLLPVAIAARCLATGACHRLPPCTAGMQCAVGWVGLAHVAHLQALQRAVVPPVVHRDADGRRQLDGDACLLSQQTAAAESVPVHLWPVQVRLRSQVTDSWQGVQLLQVISRGMAAQVAAKKRAFSSSKVKPLPRRFVRLYLMVCPCTVGRSGPAVGRGKIRLAFSARAAAGQVCTDRETQLPATQACSPPSSTLCTATIGHPPPRQFLQQQAPEKAEAHQG